MRAIILCLPVFILLCSPAIAAEHAVHFGAVGNGKCYGIFLPQMARITPKPGYHNRCFMLQKPLDDAIHKWQTTEIPRACNSANNDAVNIYDPFRWRIAFGYVWLMTGGGPGQLSISRIPLHVGERPTEPDVVLSETKERWGNIRQIDPKIKWEGSSAFWSKDLYMPVPDIADAHSLLKTERLHLSSVEKGNFIRPKLWDENGKQIGRAKRAILACDFVPISEYEVRVVLQIADLPGDAERVPLNVELQNVIAEVYDCSFKAVDYHDLSGVVPGQSYNAWMRTWKLRDEVRLGFQGPFWMLLADKELYWITQEGIAYRTIGAAGERKTEQLALPNDERVRIILQDAAKDETYLFTARHGFKVADGLKPEPFATPALAGADEKATLDLLAACARSLSKP